MLRLDGPQGSLDIYTIYLHTGDSMPPEDALEAGFVPNHRLPSSSELREAIRHRISAKMRHRDQAMSLMSGDFNFVVRKGGRKCVTSTADTGQRDHAEAELWKSTLETRHGLHEIFQPEFT